MRQRVETCAAKALVLYTFMIGTDIVIAYSKSKFQRKRGVGKDFFEGIQKRRSWEKEKKKKKQVKVNEKQERKSPFHSK